MPDFRIDEDAPIQFTLSVRGIVPDQIGDEVGKAIGEVWAYLEQHQIEPAAPPYARSTWQPGSDLEVGLVIGTAADGEGRIVAGELPGGKIAVALHTGAPGSMWETATALRAWIREQGLREAGVPWETYLTNPDQEPDATSWKTELSYPVA